MKVHNTLTGDITKIPCQCQLVRNQGQQLAAERRFRGRRLPGRGICRTGLNTIREKSERIRSGTIQLGEPLTVIRHEQLSFSARDAVCISVSSRSPDSRSRSHPFIFTRSPFPCTLFCLLRVPATFYFVTRHVLMREMSMCRRSINALYEESRREFYIGCRKLVNRFSSRFFIH